MQFTIINAKYKWKVSVVCDQPCQLLRGTAMQLVIVMWDCTCKVNLAAKRKQTFDDIKVLWPILIPSLKILTTRVKIVIIKEVIICYKVIKVKCRVQDGWYIEVESDTDTEETRQRLALHTVAVMMTFNSVLLQYFWASFGLVFSQNSVPDRASKKKINKFEPDFCWLKWLLLIEVLLCWATVFFDICVSVTWKMYKLKSVS